MIPHGSFLTYTKKVGMVFPKRIRRACGEVGFFTKGRKERNVVVGVVHMIAGYKTKSK